MAIVRAAERGGGGTLELSPAERKCDFMFAKQKKNYLRKPIDKSGTIFSPNYSSSFYL